MTQSRTNLTRRGFLAAAGATAALTALAGSAAAAPQALAEDMAPAAEETKVFNSCMGNCSGYGCPCYLTVRDGHVVNIERTHLPVPYADESPYQVSCMKAYANIERMYSPTRVLYPMKRVEGTERGAGEWERITWDEAVQEITDKWKQLLDDYGPMSICFFAGSAGANATMSYPSRLQALMGAPVCNASYDWTGMFSQWTHGGFHTHINGHNETRDVLNSDTIFMWGTNPSESYATAFHFITEAIANGTKLVVIDPNYTTAASKADLWVPIHPCTDGLLATAMGKISKRDGFVDRAKLQTLTVAPFLVKDDAMYLRLSDLGQAEAGSEDDRIMVWDGGMAVPFDQAADPEIEGTFEVEGIGTVRPASQVLFDRWDEWDLETIAEITEVPVDTIEELAALYNSGKSMIWTGYGCDHYSNGQTAYEAFFDLMDVAGQFAEHGRGCTCTDFSAPVAQGLANTSTVGLDDHVAGPGIYPTYMHKLFNGTPQGVFTEPFKSMLVYIGNPITNEPDRLSWIKDFNQMEMVVTLDPFMSETAIYSDYVLPVSFLYEHDDIATSMSAHIKYTKKAVEPMGEAMGDFEITKLLGEAMGYGEYFTQDVNDFLRDCVTNETAESMGITYDRLMEEDAIFSYTEEPFVLGLTTPPYTSTFRFEFYHEGLQPQFDAGQEWDMAKESCWFWEPPYEAWPETMGDYPAVELAEKYPLLLTSERCKFKTHTMFNNSPMILEIDPEPYIKMNPVTAEEYGVTEGDIVKLSNDRSYVVIKVVLSAGIRPGMLVIDHGWERDSYIEGHYSDLSGSESWPRYAQNNWFDCLVKLEKVS